eukprot:snap_masked-scaffold_58-processed-gene-0.55-mRNA-1 protein AED:1.00 eAED:1.00 QI:0/0/0/0/1/1/2/0/90
MAERIMKLNSLLYVDESIHAETNSMVEIFVSLKFKKEAEGAIQVEQGERSTKIAANFLLTEKKLAHIQLGAKEEKRLEIKRSKIRKYTKH